MAVNFTVPGFIPIIRQPNKETCWAAVGTMLRCWREQRSMTIEEALTIPNNPVFLERFKAKEGQRGLPPGYSAAFAKAMGFQAAPLTRMDFSPDTWLEKLKRHGPLGVATFPLHARVLIGMWGDGSAGFGNQLKLLDPDGGEQRMVLYPHFEQQFAGPKDVNDIDARLITAQIWHY